MNRGATGRYEATIMGGETVRAFVPAPLPPTPTLDLAALQSRLETALLALGRLDGLSSLLPDIRLFLYTYVRKEAVLSSQIEGTQSSLSDLLLFELDAVPGVPLDDVLEVSNYVAALEHGLRRLREDFPSATGSSGKFTRCCLAEAAAATKRPANSVVRRTGSAAAGPERRASSRPPFSPSSIACPVWSAFSTKGRPECPCFCAPA